MMAFIFSRLNNEHEVEGVHIIGHTWKWSVFICKRCTCRDDCTFDTVLPFCQIPSTRINKGSYSGT